MKNKLQISTKTSLTQRLLYASLGVGAVSLVAIFVFTYVGLGNRSDALAADGDGTCAIIISSGETGYNSNFKPYKIKIEAEILDIIPGRTNCTDGYNFNIEVAYDISFEGPGTPNINTLQGHIICDNYNLWFNFPNNTRNTGGAGTFITSVNPWRGVSDCEIITPEALGCNAITITIDGEAIPAQSNIVCPNNILLPITLAEFKAHAVNSGNLLQWSTSSEINNDFFTLERSSDGKNFEAIATIDGAGNSNEKRAYQFLDQNPAPGNNFYRLKQTDFDGQFEHFKIVMVHNQGELYAAPQPFGLGQYSIYPNPFREELNFRFEATHDGLHDIVIYNPRGEAVFNETILFSKGLNTHNLPDLTALQPGIYLVELRSDEKTYKPQRMVKL